MKTDLEDAPTSEVWFGFLENLFSSEQTHTKTLTCTRCVLDITTILDRYILIN